MKTIEEAAHEYFRAGQLGFKPAADTEAAFIAGVEFAQRWISVEEELPSAPCIALDVWEGLHVICRVYEPSAISNLRITHWRPIELKMRKKI
jgi:hypothetical protein